MRRMKKNWLETKSSTNTKKLTRKLMTLLEIQSCQRGRLLRRTMTIFLKDGLMMEPGKEQHHNVLHHLMRSCSFDSFFQCRWTHEKECSGLNLKWRNSVDSLMCTKEQHSALSDAAVKKTLSFPSTGTHELMSEIIAKDSIEKSTDMDICSEEDVLNCTFESCDIEGKGEVYVSRIIGYLEDVTGQSCEKGQLKLLHKMLNPEERDIAVNLGTFHNIMKQWIAECRQEGFSSGKNEEATSFENICILPADKKSDATSGQLEGYGGDVNRENLETTELINDIECLEYTNRKLVDQNAKLQRSVEGCEEANVRLTEEIFDLKNKLKSSQQVLLHVKLLENELEDLKSIVKNLEDKNYKLQSRNKQLEKEQQNLSTRICQLQEENGKLTAEKNYAQWRNEELVSEKAELKNQMYEAKRLISVKDVLLTEKINQSEELKSTVDEYNNIIKVK
ncbi:inositol 1,4,5-triphosphate receptor associated 2-like [Mustelus asterias]